MGIELPRELADVAAATGLSWPQADEDKLRTQAKAWRDAQNRLTSLATDADHLADSSVGALSGSAADAARTRWSGFVHPDHGKLATAARGAGEAADRLDHAADQVGAAKVEMVRQLVSAAKNRDAAQTAASAGHPTALLGLDTMLRGTATNLSAVTHGLADAVGGAGGSSPAGPVVEPNPGAHTPHGQGGLLSAVTGLPGHLVSTAGAVATPLVDKVVDDTVDTVDPVVAPLTHHSAVPAAAGLVDQTGSTADHAADELAASTMDTPRGLPQPGVPGPIPGADAGTGPIRLPQPQIAQPPQAAPYGGFLGSGSFDNVATPPSGIPLTPYPQHPAVPASPQFPGATVASGFADAGYAPPSAPPVPGSVPGALPPAPLPSPQPGYLAPPPFTGVPAPGAGPVVPPPAAGPGVTAAPGAGGVPVTGTPPAPGAGLRGGGVAGFRYPQQVAPPPAASPPPAAPAPEAPRPVAPLGAPRQERESVVALFLVHMFPIGHLPVAADRPARQLPVPPPEVDYAPGLRFPPHDHPRSELIGSSDALENIRAGRSRLPTPPASPPAELTEGYDPLAGLHERDWDRRFLAGMRGSIPEYAWPPGEVYPEGGREAGEPVVLAAGTMLDRFGGIMGRVFAQEGTLFAQRSLPPSALESGYRRYRVRFEVPMWRASSAAWFGQPGGGVRYRAVYSADELVTMGYLADVTFEETT